MSQDRFNQDQLQAHVGRSRILRELIVAEPSERLAATFDLDRIPAEPGVLPPGWHWLYFLPAAAASHIDTDGHPRRGDFLPAVPLRYRMFAGARIEWQRPLRIGRQAELSERIVAIETKQGRHGPLVFVTVERSVRQARARCLTEVQSLVYHDGTGSHATPPTDGQAFTPEWVDHERVDPVMLFRFSAVTFNAHRIHYDRDYARDVEGYPGLVVHGPLLALKLLGALRRRSGEVCTFSFRARRPVFDHQTFELHGRFDDATASLCVRTTDGYTAISAAARRGIDGRT